MFTKQTIVIRADLGMSKGKMIAQSCHASMAFLTKYLEQRHEVSEDTFSIDHDTLISKNLDPHEIEDWLHNSFTKICLYVNSEEELQTVHEAAWAAGLHSVMITDNGKTEFNGVLTKTCIAIGPHEASRIDVVTKGLKLMRN